MPRKDSPMQSEMLQGTLDMLVLKTLLKFPFGLTWPQNQQWVCTMKSFKNFIVETAELIHEFVLLFVLRLVVFRVLSVRTRTSRR